jgi:Flp pilus assembly protein CpaB
MRRSPRVVLAWIATVLVALVTARVVTNDLAILHDRARSLGKNVRVLLAVHDVALGSRIAENDLRVVERPASTVAPDAVHDVDAVDGRIATVALLEGDVLRARHLTEGIGGAIPTGRRVLHVAPTDGYQPEAGTIVEVLATFEGDTEGAARVVARGASVVALDKAPDPESGDTAPPGVTLLVTEDEARRIAFATAVGSITLALAPPETACCTSSEP